MNPTEPKTIAQILILAVGIYMLLSLLRAARGSGLVRVLGLTLIVGVYGLWWLSIYAGLPELEHIIQGLLLSVLVLLAIIFQPELRRSLVNLGDAPLLGRFLKAHRKEVIAEVAASIVAMAKKKQGALIAFERKTPLDPYIEGAVKLDCEVNRYLLDSLFHHGSALHDGAVIVRGDRVVAAAALFPLTENIEISKSTGTRHRAALGVTEETDAVSIAVSEENGFISICKRGKMERRVPRAQVEDVLRERIGSDEVAATTPDEDEERRSWIVSAFTEHLGQKLGALVLASLVFHGAHLGLIVKTEVKLGIEAPTAQQATRRVPAGTLRVVLPSEKYHLGPESSVRCEVSFEGTREQLDLLKVGVAGSVTLPRDLQAGRLELDVKDVNWGTLSLDKNVKPSWVGDPPVLFIETLDEIVVDLLASMIDIEIDREHQDARYEADLENIEFRPSRARVLGPTEAVQAFERLVQGHIDPQDGTPPTRLMKPVILDGDLTAAQWVLVTLADEDLELVTSSGDVWAKIPIRPREIEISSIEFGITVVSIAQNDVRFGAPSDRARFKIVTRGLISGEEGSPEWTSDRQAIKAMVQDNLKVFVDQDQVLEGSHEGLVVYYGLERRMWRDLLSASYPRFEDVCRDPATDLWVELETNPKVLLTATPEPNGGRD